ncbi:MAG TPA: hypothetical protein VGC85_02285 [Chthoniobacterales bacterium]
MKPLVVVFAALVCASCTTLENRRDLYRSPAEGYEQRYPYPPPTRLPNSGPVPASNGAAVGVPVQRHGVITFPDEPALPEGR